MSKRKIKRITFITTNLCGGGAERVLTQLANSLSRRGHDISIITFEALRVYELYSKVRHLSIGKVSTLALYQMMKKENSDVYISFLHHPNLHTMLANLLLRKKVIITERSDPKSELYKLFGDSWNIGYKIFFVKLLYKLADGMVFQTKWQRMQYSKKPSKKFTIICNPVAYELPDAYDGEREEKIVSVGTIKPCKNYPLLINAFARFHKEFPNYKLYIYGGWNVGKRAEISVLINRHRLDKNVVLCGFQKNVHHEIRNAAIYVLSSSFEGMPNALLEALALGLPCISTDCPAGGPRKLIQHGKNGLLVPANDEKALVNAMILLCKNKKLRDDLGNEAAKARKTFHIEKVTDQWEQFIYRILS